MGLCFSKRKESDRNIIMNKDFSELVGIDANDIPYFTFNGKELNTKVVDVYDGDTCTIIFKYNKEFVKYKLRMYGYDSPEMRPRKNIDNREEIIKLAHIAKEALIKKVLGKIVKIHFMKEEKYGRLMGNMFLGDENINEWMINNGYGYPYFGKTKKSKS
jgi:endonuclease YncB( thermonuclease family)